MRNFRGHLIRSTSYERVEAPLFCVLSRIRVRHPLALLQMALAYRRVKRDVDSIPSLKRAVFLIEDPFTFLTLSIWEGEEGFLDFNTHVTSHIETANRSFKVALRCWGLPEIWSTQWRIDALGANLNWDGIEDWVGLREHILVGGEITSGSGQSQPGGYSVGGGVGFPNLSAK